MHSLVALSHEPTNPAKGDDAEHARLGLRADLATISKLPVRQYLQPIARAHQWALKAYFQAFNFAYISMCSSMNAVLPCRRCILCRARKPDAKGNQKQDTRTTQPSPTMHFSHAHVCLFVPSPAQQYYHPGALPCVACVLDTNCVTSEQNKKKT